MITLSDGDQVRADVLMHDSDKLNTTIEALVVKDINYSCWDVPCRFDLLDEGKFFLYIPKDATSIKCLYMGSDKGTDGITIKLHAEWEPIQEIDLPLNTAVNIADTFAGKACVFIASHATAETVVAHVRIEKLGNAT